MSTVPGKLSAWWSAYFEDGHVIDQPDDDRYSKHVEGAEHNPSAFRDVIDYQEKSKLTQFHLIKGSKIYGIDLEHGTFFLNPGNFEFSFEGQNEILTDRQVIFFREVLQHNTANGGVQPPYVNRYFFGYKGRNEKGQSVEKVLNIEE